MKDFFRRLASWMHKISVMINTPPPRPVRVSAHCTNINMLLMHLCDFDADRYSYVLQWLAYPLRNPGAKMSYGLVFTGERYTGMRLFFQHVALALHEGRGRMAATSTLHERETNWVESNLVVFDGRISAAMALRVKGMITADSQIVRAGNGQVREVPNHLNFVFLTGDINPMRCTTDRRFLVIDTPPTRDRIFYHAVEHEIKNGGVDAFRDYLLHGIDMAGFNESTLPPGLRDTYRLAVNHLARFEESEAMRAAIRKHCGMSAEANKEAA